MIAAALVLGATLATPIPLDRARRVLDEARLASDEDGGQLWGRTLCGPMLLVDPQTRFVVANQPDNQNVLASAGGVFVGTLPPDVVIANTATEWNGMRWTMVMWPSIGDRLVQRRRLLLHECWHRIQPEIGFASTEADNAHLDSLDGRVGFSPAACARCPAAQCPRQKAETSDPRDRSALSRRGR